MIDLNDVRSLTEFQRNTREHLRRLQETGRPEVLTVNGRAALVVQSAAGYQQLLDRVADPVRRHARRRRTGGPAVSDHLPIPYRPAVAGPLATRPADALPAVVAEAGDNARFAYEEFFSGLDSPHTIAAYRRDLNRFLDHVHELGLALHQVTPKMVRAYIDHLRPVRPTEPPLSAPTHPDQHAGERHVHDGQAAAEGRGPATADLAPQLPRRGWNGDAEAVATPPMFGARSAARV